MIFSSLTFLCRCNLLEMLASCFTADAHVRMQRRRQYPSSAGLTWQRSWPERWPSQRPLSCYSVCPVCCRTGADYSLCPDHLWVQICWGCDARLAWRRCVPSSAEGWMRAMWQQQSSGTGSQPGASSSCQNGRGSDIPGCRSPRPHSWPSAGSLQ